LLLLKDTATTSICTLSLHDALPIYFGQRAGRPRGGMGPGAAGGGQVRARLFLRPRGIRLEQRGTDAANERANRKRIARAAGRIRDRKSTRLNSSHVSISYAVFCLKK